MKRTPTSHSDVLPTPPWFTKSMAHLKRHLRWCQRHDSLLLPHIRAEYKRTTRRAKRLYERDRAKKIESAIYDGDSRILKSFRNVPKTFVSPISADAWGEHLINHFEGSYHRGFHALPLPQALAHVASHVECPSFESLHGNVVRHLRRLDPNSSSGFFDPPPPFLKAQTQSSTPPHAQVFILAPFLTSLVRACLRSSDIPSSWKITKMIPIFKKGQLWKPSNYRMIAINGVLYRLFASVVCDLLMKWALDEEVLPQTQFGFVPGRSTLDPVFILLHCLAIVRKEHRLGSLALVLVDFQAAYDSIDRRKMWRHLETLRVPSYMLNIIAAMYREDVYVLYDGCLCPPVSPGRGLRQGCPLSPLLFALYISDLHSIFNPDDGARTADRHLRITDAEYADDLALASNSMQGMQNMLSALEGYADTKGLVVNVEKTQAIVLGRSIRNGVLRYKGTPLIFVDSVKYLGIPFSKNMSLRGIGMSLHHLFTGGLARVWHIVHQHHLGDRILTYIRLMQAFALSPGSYGSQLWAVAALSAPEMSTPQEMSYMRFLKQILHVRTSAHNPSVLQECGVPPLKLYFWRMVLRFYNRLCSHNSPLVREVIRADIHASPSRYLWSSHFIKALEDIGDVGSVGRVRDGLRVNVNDVLRGVQVTIVRSWLHRTSDFRSTRSVSPFYQEVSSPHPLQVGKSNLFRLVGASYLGRYLSRQRRAALANFRLRCAPLNFLLSARDGSCCGECSWCFMGVQDEHHLFFECRSTQMSHLRGRFPSLFRVNNLRSFFHQCPIRLSEFFKDLYLMLCASGHMSG